MGKSKIVVSDLHLGAGFGGQGNALEDFDSDDILAAFLDGLVTESESTALEMELLFAGDTFEFLQVPALDPSEPFLPTVRYPSERYRSSAEEPSRRKAELIVAGHPIFFTSLRAFLRPDPPRRTVTFIKGNHDVHLHWRAVQETIREALGAVDEWEGCLSFVERRVSREGIYVEHGNQYAGRLNRFPDFEEPHDPGSPDELYQPAGSRFVYEFFNEIEWTHYWVDGVKPMTALIWYCLALDFGLAVRALKTLLKALPAATRDGGIAPGGKEASPDMLGSLLEELEDEKHLRVVQRDNTLRDGFHRRVARVLRAYGGDKAASDSEEEEYELTGAWRNRALQRGMAEERSQRDGLAEMARLRHAQEQAQVVIFGHSHEPQSVPLGEGAAYINLGTWTWRRDFSGESYTAWRKLFRHPELYTRKRVHTYARVNYDVQGRPEAQLRELEVAEPPRAGGWQRLKGWLRGRR